MDRPVTALAHHSTGLTHAHKAFIRMLAEICVEDFLAESESNIAIEAAPADEHREVAR